MKMSLTFFFIFIFCYQLFIDTNQATNTNVEDPFKYIAEEFYNRWVFGSKSSGWEL